MSNGDGLELKQAVILAGGLGTRLRPFTDVNPKPMYPFNEKPFIEYLVRQVKGFGIREILILLGYLPEKIMDYLGDGSQYDVNIKYDVTPVEYETGSRLRCAKDKIADTFLLMYCDNYCPVDYSRLVHDYCYNNALIQITAYSNRDGYTKSNLIIGDTGNVIVYDKKRITENLFGVDIGYAIVDKRTLDLIPEMNCNYESIVYPKLVEQNKLYATVVEHRYYSVGSYDRISLTEEFFKNKKCVFLDRDGTLNVRPPKACYIEKKEDFVWLSGAKEAVKLLNDNGYMTILISNQPGIARGNLTEITLKQIHDKMQNDLRQIGAHIDAIYYCPHNWDDGCFCRKPKPGMLFEAQRDYSLNLSMCHMVGDDERDIEAGESAGCICHFVDDNRPLLEIVKGIIDEESKI